MFELLLCLFQLIKRSVEVNESVFSTHHWFLENSTPHTPEKRYRIHQLTHKFHPKSVGRRKHHQAASLWSRDIFSHTASVLLRFSHQKHESSGTYVWSGDTASHVLIKFRRAKCLFIALKKLLSPHIRGVCHCIPYICVHR